MQWDRIHIEDFQSLADVTLDIGKGLTIVRGASSTGKSAVFRAAHLLAHNSSRVPVRQGRTSAKVTVSGAHTVGVERGKSKSVYSIDSEKYPKAGTSVPDDVSKTLGLADGLHFASQFDKPFLVDEAGSTVTKIFDTLTKAETLTSAVREGTRRKNRASQTAQIRGEDVVSLQQQIDEYADLSEREAVTEQAEKCIEEAAHAEQQADRLNSLILSVEESARAASELSEAKHDIEFLDSCITAADRIARAVQTVEALTDRHTEAAVVRDALESTAVSAETLNKASAAIDKALSTIESLHSAVARYEQAQVAAVEAQAEVDKSRQAVLKSEADYRNMLDASGTCPLCGNDLKDRHGDK